jgi:hypothetical protein
MHEFARTRYRYIFVVLERLMKIRRALWQMVVFDGWMEWSIFVP